MSKRLHKGKFSIFNKIGWVLRFVIESFDWLKWMKVRGEHSSKACSPMTEDITQS